MADKYNLMPFANVAVAGIQLNGENELKLQRC